MAQSKRRERLQDPDLTVLRCQAMPNDQKNATRLILMLHRSFLGVHFNNNISIEINVYNRHKDSTLAPPLTLSCLSNVCVCVNIIHIYIYDIRRPLAVRGSAPRSLYNIYFYCFVPHNLDDMSCLQRTSCSTENPNLLEITRLPQQLLPQQHTHKEPSTAVKAHTTPGHYPRGGANKS